MTNVTQVLLAANGGDPHAAAELLPLVYDELRRLAEARMAAERVDHTLQPTALVHEAYLRLVDGGQTQGWNGRRHFFAAAAEAMRRILVEQARRKTTRKRGGGITREGIDPDHLAANDPDEDLVALDEALRALAARDPLKAELVQLRHFAGLTIEEAAQALGISVTTANRYWAYARAWLHQQVGRSSGTEEAGPG